MRRVLVTGGAGFIGSSLTKALLLSKNCHVTVLDNLSRGSQENISHWLGTPNFEFIKSDLLDYSYGTNEQKSLLQEAVDSSDIIFHLAANPDIVIGSENTHIDFQQNVHATHNLPESISRSQVSLDLSAGRNERRKKELIFASSSAIYEEADKRPTLENYSPLYPISLYGASKLACEAMISGYCHIFDIQCVIARLANIIGPTNAHGVVYDFITKLSSHPEYLDILGNGQQNKSYFYIDDCVSTLVLISEKMQSEDERTSSHDKNGERNRLLAYENSNGESNKSHRDIGDRQKHSQLEVYNVGSDDTSTVMEIARIVIDQLSLKNQEVRKVFKNNLGGGRRWKGDVPEFWLDCSKLKGIGWQPKYGDSNDAIIQTCKEYLKTNTRKKNH
jgi:UDP-glucose 4-epimerase